MLPCTRRGEVQGRSIVVFDDLIDAAEVEAMNAALKLSKFGKTEYARRETMQFTHWVTDLDPGQVRALPLYRAAAQAVQDYFGQGYDMFRTYCNVALYGDMLMTHTDCKPSDEVVTTLWYIAARWEAEWGGETLFFDDRDDALFVVTPRPGRLVAFDGAIKHVGRPPNRNCYEPRFTLAMKFRRA